MGAFPSIEGCRCANPEGDAVFAFNFVVVLLHTSCVSLVVENSSGCCGADCAASCGAGNMFHGVFTDGFEPMWL